MLSYLCICRLVSLLISSISGHSMYSWVKWIGSRAVCDERRRVAEQRRLRWNWAPESRWTNWSFARKANVPSRRTTHLGLQIMTLRSRSWRKSLWWLQQLLRLFFKRWRSWVCMLMVTTRDTMRRQWSGRNTIRIPTEYLYVQKKSDTQHIYRPSSIEYRNKQSRYWWFPYASPF